MVAQMPGCEDKLIMLIGMDQCQFYEPVLPGDQLVLKAQIHKVKGPIGKPRGRRM